MKTDNMAKRHANLERTPRFMQPQEFEDEAALLLAEYGQERGIVTAPPIPIDDIIEEHLKIAVELRDLRTEFPEGDVLGAIYFSQKLIVVDQSLVPEEFPAMRGRYRFTLAHELAHWRLHRHLYLRRAAARPLLADAGPQPDHVFRSGAPDPKEFQANQLASCILMPREIVKRCWHDWRGDMEPIALDEMAANIGHAPAKSGDDPISKSLLEESVRPLAEMFEVSPEAMRIRLVGMKLIVLKREPSLFA